jgi:hypothetical protein
MGGEGQVNVLNSGVSASPGGHAQNFASKRALPASYFIRYRNKIKIAIKFSLQRQNYFFIRLDNIFEIFTEAFIKHPTPPLYAL